MSVDEDVEHEESERGSQGVQGEGQQLVVDDEVTRPQELSELELRYLALFLSREIERGRRFKRGVMNDHNE